MIIFATHNILTEETSQQGRLLLQCLRAYLIHMMYLAFDVHTQDTIKAGRAALARFSRMLEVKSVSVPPMIMTSRSFLQEYSIVYPDKVWAFPKLHAQQHAYDDILAKGVTANYSTKPNEKCHKPYRDTYEQQTNFKNVAP